MHASGHDGHLAILMVTAKILSRHKKDIYGNIKFVFQPNEEEAGALDMINEGVLEKPGCRRSCSSAFVEPYSFRKYWLKRRAYTWYNRGV
mgnify:CR=1 FL=1